MKTRITVIAMACLLVVIANAVPGVLAQKKHQNAVIDIWAQGKPVFGVYVPSEGQPLWNTPAPPPNPAGRGQGAAAGGPPAQGARGGGPPAERPKPRYTKEIGMALAKDPLVDFAFLNLEEGYDAAAARAVSDGLNAPGGSHRVTLIVRIPTIEDAGAELTKLRVKEVLESGADGVTIPHIRNLEEAKTAIGFFQNAKVDVWSPSNPNGEKLAMLMLEDPQSIQQAREVADLKGFSILACGIGSLGGAFRAGGIVSAIVNFGLLTPEQGNSLNELGTQKILAEAKRAKLPNMLTANASNVEKRVKEGFLALLMSGPGSDDAIKIGRTAAGR